MNNKNIFLRKSASVCLLVTVSACQQDSATAPDAATNAPGFAATAAANPDIAARWTADSLALRNGDEVSLWPDSSLHGRDATADEGSRPTYKVVNGVPMVHFDGIDDYLTVSATTDWRFLKDGSEWTVFVVFRSAAGALGREHALLDTDGPDAGFEVSYTDRADAASNDAVRLSAALITGAYDVDLAGSNRGFPTGRWGIISARFRPSPDRTQGEASLFVNGYRKVATETEVRPIQTRGAIRLSIGRHGSGSAIPANGDIREIVIYRKALTEDEHHEAIRQLARKVSPAVRIRTPVSQKWLSANPNGYQGFGIAFRSPSSGKLVAIQRQGVSHFGGVLGEIRQWESTDRGATWTNRSMYDSEYDDRNVGGGVTSTGSVLAFFGRYDGDHWVDMRALRSVDDAETFSDIGTPLPTNGTVGFSPYGPLVQLPSGRLLQTFYGGNRLSTSNKVWISESVDDGLTWTYKADIYSGPIRVTETSVAWISGVDDSAATLVAVSRNDSGAGLLQFVSHDGGSTWLYQGLIPGGHRSDLSPWLYTLSDGTLVNAWHERSWFSFNIRMGVGADVAVSPSNWGRPHGTYQAVTRVVGDSGYPAVLSATGWDDDLIQVLYDRQPGGNSNILISPISLP